MISLQSVQKPLLDIYFVLASVALASAYDSKVSICLPPLKTLRHAVDRLKNLSNYLVGAVILCFVWCLYCPSLFAPLLSVHQSASVS